MNHLSLFNGIGGFQIAAYWAGWNNIAHVEIDEWCNSIVKQWFPNSQCYGDIKKFTGEQYAGSIDIISSSDPCQPHSIAGLRKGTKDDRYLWPEALRIIRTINPTWIINENVIGTVSNGVLDRKIDDLENIGYSCQSYNIPAESVGALHIRQRVWLVGYNSDFNRVNRKPSILRRKKEKKRMEKRKYIQLNIQPIDLRNELTNSNGQRLQKQHMPSISESKSEYFGFGFDATGSIPREKIKSAIIRMLNGLPKELDYRERTKRIKALGNAIVPQVALQIFRVINLISNK